MKLNNSSLLKVRSIIPQLSIQNKVGTALEIGI
jgi:hypothetical protein